MLNAGDSREWIKPSESAPRHWLQVNGLRLGDKPARSQAKIERMYGRSSAAEKR